MKIAVTNILACSDFNHEIGKGGLLGIIGNNETGKTSIAISLMSCLTRNSNSLKLTIPMMKYYLKDGADTGGAVVSMDDKNFVRWDAKSRTVQEVGSKVPTVQPGCVGGIDIITLSTTKLKTEYWEKELGIGTSIDKLEADMMPLLINWRNGDKDLAKRDFKGIVGVVETEGFDGAEKQYRSRKTQLVGAWSQSVAGVGESMRWGKAQSAEWRPQGWTSELDNTPIEEIKENISTLNEQIKVLTNTSIKRAVNKEEIQRKKDRIGDNQIAIVKASEELDRCKVQLDRSTAELSRHDTIVRSLEKTRDYFVKTIKHAKAAVILHCYKCGAENQVVAKVDSKGKKEYTLIKPDSKHNDTAIAQMKRDLAEAEEELTTAKFDRKVVYNEREKASNDYDTADIAVNNLQAEIDVLKRQIIDMENRSGKSTDEDIEKHNRELNMRKDALAEWQSCLKMKEVNAEANKIHRDILLNDNIAYRLGPKGYRADKMKETLVKVRKVAEKICKACGWPVASIADDLSLSWGGYPAVTAAKSAKWRLQAVLQLAVAFCTKCPIVLLDGGDILDDKNYQTFTGFLRDKIAGKHNISVIWCATRKPNQAELLDGWEIKEIDNGV